MSGSSKIHKIAPLFTLISIVAIVASPHSVAADTASSDQDGQAYVRIFSARVTDGLELSLDELEIIARERGTEEVALFPAADGPEAKSRVWLVRRGDETYAYPGYTSKARAILSEQMELGALEFSGGGRTATGTLPCLKSPMVWTLPDDNDSPAVCRLYEDGELVRTMTIYETPSPHGRWPRALRMDTPPTGITIVQVFDYLDEKPDGLPDDRQKPDYEFTKRVAVPRAPASDELEYGMDFVSFSGLWGWPGFGITWDWSYSWVELYFSFEAAANVNSTVDGNFFLEKQTDTTGELAIGSGGGLFGMNFVLACSMSVTIDYCVDRWTLPFPFPNLDYGTSDTTQFYSYLLDDEVSISGYLGEAEIISVGYDLDPWGSGSAVVNASLTLNATMGADSIVTSDGVVFTGEAQTEPVNLAAGEYAEELDYEEHLDVSVDVTFWPDVCAALEPYGCEILDACLSDLGITMPSFTWNVPFDILNPDINFSADSLYLYADETAIISVAIPKEDRGNLINRDGGLLEAPFVGDECMVERYDFNTTTPEGWTSVSRSGRGDFAGLFTGLSQRLEDLCLLNYTTMWGFLSGSTYNYDCGGHVGVPSVPSGSAEGEYLVNEIWSPQIEWIDTWPCNTAELRFDVYRDLPFSFGVFYVWHVRTWIGGSPGPWRDRGHVYYGRMRSCRLSESQVGGGAAEWWTAVERFGDLVEPGAEYIQVALGAWDMSGFWYGRYPFDDCHSNAPYFDNIEVRRYNTSGPRWGVREVDLFQDAFPENGTASGTARADMAKDIAPYWNPTTQPGDSVCVWVGDPVDGLQMDISGCGTAVYCYVSVDGGSYTAAQLEAPEAGPCSGVNGAVRYPVIGSVGAAGRTWHQIQMDSVFTDVDRRSPLDGRYCVDLNDNLFVPSDEILFFFGAENTMGEWTYWSEFTGHTPSIEYAATTPMEFQVLPTGADVLYVDRADGTGAQLAFDAAFGLLGVTADRYDVRGPSSHAGNNLAARVPDFTTQIIPFYRTIVWNTGDLSVGTLGGGTGLPSKEDDALLLYAFLDGNPDTTCVYFSGDDIAEEWEKLAGYTHRLREDYIDFDLVDDDHMVDPSDVISPMIIGRSTSQLGFEHATDPDTMIAFAGYPFINDFDIITPSSPAKAEMSFGGGVDRNVIISQQTTNPQGMPARVVLSGVSFHNIYDDRPAGEPDRVEHLRHILQWFRNGQGPPTGGEAEPQYTNHVAQNYPNPFNPTTTIEYSIAEPARVTLKVYNIAGKLVRTLVDHEMQHPARVRPVTWDGRNDAGQMVSSGVYLYKFVTKNFTTTKKLVLLK